MFLKILIILVSLTMTKFSKKMFISNRRIRVFMPNLHKKKLRRSLLGLANDRNKAFRKKCLMLLKGVFLKCHYNSASHCHFFPSIFLYTWFIPQSRYQVLHKSLKASGGIYGTFLTVLAVRPEMKMSSIFLKLSTFEGVFFHILMGKTNTKLECL